MKILDFAIDVEKAEQDLYKRLAACSANQGIKAIFEMIATKEMLLLDKLRHLKKNPQHYKLNVNKIPKQINQIKHTQGGNCELLEHNDVRDDLSSYSYIIRTEQLVFNLYTCLKESQKDPQSQRVLDILLAEKQQEIDRISTIYDVARIIH